MGCCGDISYGMIESMCESIKKMEQFQKKFIIEFQDSTITGEMTQINTGYKYKIRYWYFDDTISDKRKFTYYFN